MQGKMFRNFIKVKGSQVPKLKILGFVIKKECFHDLNFFYDWKVEDFIKKLSATLKSYKAEIVAEKQ